MPTEPPLFPDYLPLYTEGISAKNVIATPMKIGFLGLGTMGTGIVSNLLRSGHEVTVWNRTPSKVG
jgi:glutamyl-tRNA reductase